MVPPCQRMRSPLPLTSYCALENANRILIPTRQTRSSSKAPTVAREGSPVATSARFRWSPGRRRRNGRMGDLRTCRRRRRQPCTTCRVRSSALPCASPGSSLEDAMRRAWTLPSRRRLEHCYRDDTPLYAPRLDRRHQTTQQCLDQTSLHQITGPHRPHLIYPPRLDAAIRALAPASMASICISNRARDLLLVLLSAQRRSLLSFADRGPDHRGSHALVSARALLTVAEHGGDAVIYEHIDSYAEDSALLGNLIRALAATAEEAPQRAATAMRIWPTVVRRALELNELRRASRLGPLSADQAPRCSPAQGRGRVSYLYRELHGDPISWWNPHEMQSEVQAWLKHAPGRAFCVDHLIGFLRVLAPEERVRMGLPWVWRLVLADPTHAAGNSFLLPDWLIDTRSTARIVGLSDSWQQVVDALVVAGITRLAPYSL